MLSAAFVSFPDNRQTSTALPDLDSGILCREFPAVPPRHYAVKPPKRVCTELITASRIAGQTDIAQSFNKFYYDEHILVDNEDEKLAKIALVCAAKATLAAGLGLLGIKAPEKM